MTNREMLINSLKEKRLDAYTVNYIACVNDAECKKKEYNDDSCCAECKKKWLNQELEG